ncbi:MAG: aminotransferase class V-fold PLP-dependent enzyme, partial [Rhodothermaceae bacterium]|nr:aminotransferase class V-fold PLP-dependent enzyme [Rhodothermaceae bacterium]
FEEGDVILTTRNDYASNYILFLSLQQRFGIRIEIAPELPVGGVDAEAMIRLIRTQHPRLVSVTQIPTNSGLVQEVASIGRVCRDEGVLYIIDACQSVGQRVVDVGEIPCDFLSVTSRKFLRGPRGSGFLYVSDRVLDLGYAPLILDMRGADWMEEGQYRLVDDARRFENWEFAWALVLATGEAARYASEIGLSVIQQRVKKLSGSLREALGQIEGVHVLDRGQELGGIVTLWVEGWDPADLVIRLRERNINTSSQVRSSAVLDYDDKGVTGSLRFSPHYFNTEDELDRAVDVFKDVLRTGH